MTITKRDAEDLAEVFHRVGRKRVFYTADQIKHEIADEIARVGEKSNPRFNRKQFLNAAGMSPDEARNEPFVEPPKKKAPRKRAGGKKK